MTTCATCQRAVDPLRAPAVSVRDGKVVAFCSKDCAAAAESKPVAMPAQVAKRTPASGVVAYRRTPVRGVPTEYDSGPVIEVIHEPASGVVTAAADARAGTPVAPARAGTDGTIEIADSGRIDDYVELDGPRRGRATLVVLVLVLAMTGGAFAAYRLGYLDDLLHRTSSAAVPPPAPPVVREAPPDAAPAVTLQLAVDRARDVLRAQLRSNSPRIQHVAAAALARTGDPDAIAALVVALGTETSDVAKLDLAYALARAGDQRGTDALVAQLAARRDVKAEAARRLALLGDRRAIPTLSQFLQYDQFRLGAAESLALLVEPHAVEALDAIRKDPKASPDDQARAAIALGLAGRADVAAALRALLSDTRFNAFAAASLASLHDPAARPILVKHLEIPSLRVAAARALRRLEPDLDAAPLLPPLLALLAGKDTEQVQAAEAVLLLAGPAAWSARE